MSNEENGKPAAPPPKTQRDLNLDLGRALLGHAYAGSAFGVNTQTGENVGFNIASETEKETARQETDAGVEAVGVEFAKLKNQLAAMQATMAKQQEEVDWLRTERANGGKKSKKGKK